MNIQINATCLKRMTAPEYLPGEGCISFIGEKLVMLSDEKGQEHVFGFQELERCYDIMPPEETPEQSAIIAARALLKRQSKNPIKTTKYEI